jgi:hypothetical protein
MANFCGLLRSAFLFGILRNLLTPFAVRSVLLFCLTVAPGLNLRLRFQSRRFVITSATIRGRWADPNFDDSALGMSGLLC